MPIIRDRLCKLNPSPTRQIPILIGGTGPKKTMRLVAQHATGWHALFPDDPEDLVPAISALEGWCAQLDRDPREIEWSLGLMPEDDGRVLAQHAEQYISMGFTQFTFGTNGPDYNLEGLQEWLSSL